VNVRANQPFASIAVLARRTVLAIASKRRVNRRLSQKIAFRAIFCYNKSALFNPATFMIMAEIAKNLPGEKRGKCGQSAAK